MWININADLAPSLIDVFRHIESKSGHKVVADFRALADKIEAEAAAVKSPERAKLIEEAKDLYARSSSDDIEVDDEADISEAEMNGGTWVMGWLWVENDEEEEEQERSCPGCHELMEDDANFCPYCGHKLEAVDG